MLIHKISIPVEKMTKHYTYGMFDSSYLVDELGGWMKENIKYSWNWDVGRGKDQKYYLVFRFEDKKDAVAFKLRWG